MIFQHTHELVLSGTKTQTRRICKPYENLCYPENDTWNAVVTGQINKNGDPRFKWQVGKDYAVQPGRGKSAVGRIRITDICRECVQDISAEDAIAEGVRSITPSRNGFYADPKEHLFPWSTQRIGPAYYDYKTRNYHTQLGKPVWVDGQVVDVEPEAGSDFCCCFEGRDAARHPAVCSYKSLWDSINTKSGTRWDDNPEVWVLTFTLAEATA